MGVYFVFLVCCALFEPVWSDAEFTTRPKNREVFVGDDVQFDWGYRDNDDKKVDIIFFGLVNGSNEMTIVRKAVSTEILKWNANFPSSMRERIKVKESDTGHKTSMKITSVQMNDKGTYFCKLSWDELGKQPLSSVSLQVVDLLITDDSDDRRNSWNTNQIYVNCAVKVAHSSVRFTWKRETKAENRTLPRHKHRDTLTESQFTLETNKEEDYNDLLCIANTPSTTKVHRITIRQLRLPDPPQNLKQDRFFEKKKGYVINRLLWEIPLNDGGTSVDKYVIQYKPEGIDWKQAKEGETKDLEFKELKLKNGKIYNARVRAVNRVGRSNPSNVLDVQLADVKQTHGGSRAFGAQVASHSASTLFTWCIAYHTVMKLFFS